MGKGDPNEALAHFLGAVRDHRSEEIRDLLLPSVTLKVKALRRGRVSTIIFLQGVEAVGEFLQKTFPELGDYELRLAESDGLHAAVEWRGATDSARWTNLTMLIEFSGKAVVNISIMGNT